MPKSRIKYSTHNRCTRRFSLWVSDQLITIVLMSKCSFYLMLCRCFSVYARQFLGISQSMISWRTVAASDTRQSSLSYSALWIATQPHAEGATKSRCRNSVGILEPRGIAISAVWDAPRSCSRNRVWSRCLIYGIERCAGSGSRYPCRSRACPACRSLGRLRSKFCKLAPWKAEPSLYKEWVI